MRIVLIEDHASLAESIRKAIEAMDHAVDVIDDGDLAVDVLASQDFDLAILDLALPGADGIEVLRTLRQRGSAMPVLILTARTGLDDRIKGLDLGADDYLTKPFEMAELEARVRALLRRSDGIKCAMVTYGPLSFDTGNRVVHLDGEDINLTPRERGVLEVLVRNHASVVRKEQIGEHIFSFNDDASLTAIELYVHRLRKKLDHPDVQIRTIRGLGYMLECE